MQATLLRPAKSPGIKNTKRKASRNHKGAASPCSITLPPPQYHNSSSKATPTAYSAPSCCCSGVAARPAHTQQLLCETQGSVSFFKLRKNPLAYTHTGTHTHACTPSFQGRSGGLGRNYQRWLLIVISPPFQTRSCFFCGLIGSRCLV